MSEKIFCLCNKNSNKYILFIKVITFVLILVLMLAFLGSSIFVKADSKWPNSVEDANSSGIWPSIENIPAKAWLVVDMESGDEILKFNENEKLYPASTTKIMTAYVALKDPDYNPDQILIASEEAVDLGWDSSKIYLQADETIKMRDALAGLMLASGNDAANVIAEGIAGSASEFARRMTIEAVSLGTVQTSFMNSHGLHDEDHYTTASDLAVITRAAMQLPEFRELVATTSYSLPASNKHVYNGWNTILNTNRLLHFDQSYLYSEYIKEITGIKTGTTSAAGFCLVSSAITHDGRELLCVLMGIPYSEIQGNTWIYSRTLLEEAAIAIDSPAIALSENDMAEDLIDEQTETVIHDDSEGQEADHVDEASSGEEDEEASESNEEKTFWESNSKLLLTSFLLGFSTLILFFIVIRQRSYIRKVRKNRAHVRNNPRFRQ